MNILYSNGFGLFLVQYVARPKRPIRRESNQGNTPKHGQERIRAAPSGYLFRGASIQSKHRAVSDLSLRLVFATPHKR